MSAFGKDIATTGEKVNDIQRSYPGVVFDVDVVQRKNILGIVVLDHLQG